MIGMNKTEIIKETKEIRSEFVRVLKKRKLLVFDGKEKKFAKAVEKLYDSLENLEDAFNAVLEFKKDS
jgi:galactokinase/mevalonate kinase-like predicted kinase